LENYFKNESLGCKITRYRLASLIAFALSKFASVGVSVSVFWSTGIYPINSHRMPEYMFGHQQNCNLCGNSNPKYGSGFVPSTSVTNSQNVLHILAEPSGSILTYFLHFP